MTSKSCHHESPISDDKRASSIALDNYGNQYFNMATSSSKSSGSQSDTTPITPLKASAKSSLKTKPTSSHKPTRTASSGNTFAQEELKPLARWAVESGRDGPWSVYRVDDSFTSSDPLVIEEVQDPRGDDEDRWSMVVNAKSEWY
ncbi:hypothetical protein BDZ45DRAFT_693168 [Acephala macrosclerotiorum]|nr:hypothetical protein BDZ45DRAFT_693168 [Acephala macrosclerotiorum]